MRVLDSILNIFSERDRDYHRWAANFNCFKASLNEKKTRYLKDLSSWKDEKLFEYEMIQLLNDRGIIYYGKILEDLNPVVFTDFENYVVNNEPSKEEYSKNKFPNGSLSLADGSGKIDILESGSISLLETKTFDSKKTKKYNGHFGLPFLPYSILDECARTWAADCIDSESFLSLFRDLGESSPAFFVFLEQILSMHETIPVHPGLIYILICLILNLEPAYWADYWVWRVVFLDEDSLDQDFGFLQFRKRSRFFAGLAENYNFLDIESNDFLYWVAGELELHFQSLTCYASPKMMEIKKKIKNKVERYMGPSGYYLFGFLDSEEFSQWKTQRTIFLAKKKRDKTYLFYEGFYGGLDV